MDFKLDEDGYVMHSSIDFEDFDIIRKYLEWRVYELGWNAEEAEGSEQAAWRKHYEAIKAELEGFLKFERICRQLPNEQESKGQVAKAACAP